MKKTTSHSFGETGSVNQRASILLHEYQKCMRKLKK